MVKPTLVDVYAVDDEVELRINCVSAGRKATVAALRTQTKAHKRSMQIMIGGDMIDEQLRQYIGADYWVSDAMAGVRLCEALLNNNR